jgi:hypothetical protein
MGLTQTAEPAREVHGVETIEVVADEGYLKIEDIEASKKAGMEQLCLRSGSASSSLFVFASAWAEEDQPSQTSWHAMIPRSACGAGVASFAWCPGLRTIRYWTGCERDRRSGPMSLIAVMIPRTSVWPDQAMDVYEGAFLVRGLRKVRAEFSLTALVYDLRRMLSIVGSLT